MKHIEITLPFTLRGYVVSLLLLATASSAETPQLVFSANDQTSGYLNGGMYVRPHARSGSLTVLDFSIFPPRVWHQEEVPCSVIGPPTCVTATLSGDIVLVAGAMHVDSTNPEKLTVDRRVTLLAWSTTGLRQLAQAEIGNQPSGVALAASGHKAYVTLRADGKLARLDLTGDRIRVEDETQIAAPTDSLSHIALSPDERIGLVTLHDKGTVLVLDLGGRVIRVIQEVPIGRGPYDVRFLGDGRKFVVTDTQDDILCVFAEQNGKWTIAQRLAVGHGPEGFAVSSDQRWIAVNCFEGANATGPKDKWYHAPSRIYMLKLSDGIWKQQQILEVDAMPQGSAFSPNGHFLVVGQTGLGNLRVFLRDSDVWVDTKMRIEVPGQPAALATAGGH